jgi:hypothetical protein
LGLLDVWKAGNGHKEEETMPVGLSGCFREVRITTLETPGHYTDTWKRKREKSIKKQDKNIRARKN